jgi:hypothetical protein
MASKALAVKGIDVSTIDPPRETGAKHVESEFKGRGNATLLAWLKYWLNPKRSQDEADAIGTTREQEIAKIRDELVSRGVDLAKFPSDQGDRR